MAITTGLKEKLSIKTCTVSASGSISVNDAPKFEAMINPAGYKRELKICYNNEKTLGQSGPEPKFAATLPQTLTLRELVLDGTGVVGSSGLRSVKDMVDALLGVIYKYDGQKHEPNYVCLVWGSFIFYGRATAISIDYTMFKPSGEPLRAKVSLSFVNWMSKEETALRANQSSPDLSHLVEVAMGDTLPLLCNRIYKNPSYYREVARVNNLTNFRNLEPGTMLRFPPLVNRHG
jgi:hypothetical protein